MKARSPNGERIFSNKQRWRKWNEFSKHENRFIFRFPSCFFNHTFYNAWKIVKWEETKSDAAIGSEENFSPNPFHPFKAESKKKAKVPNYRRCSVAFAKRQLNTLYQTSFQTRSDATYPITREDSLGTIAESSLRTWGELSINQLLAMMI